MCVSVPAHAASRGPDCRLQDILTSPHVFKWLFEGEDLVLNVKLRVRFGWNIQVLGLGEGAGDYNIAMRVLTKMGA